MIGMVHSMSNRILFTTGEGIGNVMQCLPVIRTLREVLNYDVDFWCAFGSFSVPKIIPYVDKWFIGSQINTVDMSKYVGLVSTLWTTNHIKNIPLQLLNNIKPLSMEISEVSIYMDIARDLGAKEEDLIWYGECLYNKRKEKYDIVLNNGYNRAGSANWQIKSYPYYKELTSLLIDEGYSVCSVGAPNEHIKGTVNLTGLNLLDSLGVIKNSKLLISNDSGLYHCANALGVQNLVIFTATSIDKNFDYRFHKFSTIIGRDNLKCRPCQAGRRWNRDCKDWQCRKIDPQDIVEIVRNKL